MTDVLTLLWFAAKDLMVWIPRKVKELGGRWRQTRFTSFVGETNEKTLGFTTQFSSTRESLSKACLSREEFPVSANTVQHHHSVYVRAEQHPVRVRACARAPFFARDADARRAANTADMARVQPAVFRSCTRRTGIKKHTGLNSQK